MAETWARTIEGSVLLRVDVDRAEQVLDEALAASRALRYGGGRSVALRSLALAALCRDDPATAATRVVELLDDLLGRGSTYELRMVFDLAAVLVQRAGRIDAAADLAATARALPVVSITASIDHELFPVDAGGGAVLGVRDAIRRTRDELGEVSGERPAASTATTAPATGPRTGASPHLAAEARQDRDESGPPAPIGVLRPVGDHWEVGFDGDLVTVRATKGMGDLARLVAAPGREVHCLELIGAGTDDRRGGGDTGPVIDATARHAYEQRIRDLQAELDDADAAHDRGRSETVQAEMDALVDHLTAALGLGGRPRRTGDAAERARSTVTQRIRSTIRRIAAVHPRMGRHLQASIRTATFCSYTPEQPLHWHR